MIAAVFWLSLSALALEVLLARIFSLTQWHHLGFMVLSIALFGFGASGAFLAFRERSDPGWEGRWSAPSGLSRLTLGFSISAIAAAMGLARLPLDYFRLPFEPAQFLYLAAAYLLLTIPFAFAGASISLAYAAAPRRSGAIYFANMAGSALGAALPSLLLPWLDEGRSAAAVGVLPLILLPGWIRKAGPGDGRRLGAATLAITAAAVFLLSPAGARRVRVRPSPYKALSQVRQLPGTETVSRGGGLRGRIDQIRSPYLRFAPGLSLRFTRPVSIAGAVYRDAERPIHLYAPDPEGGFAFVRHSLARAGHLASDRPDSVFAILRGGGVSIPAALEAGAAPPTVAVDHPGLARRISAHYGWPARAGSARSMLARSRERYGVIHLENWGPSLPGAGALDQNDDTTVEAMRLYLRRLRPGGVLMLQRRLLLPPSDMVRNFAAAHAALAAEGAADPARHLAVLRNWDVYALLVSPAPLGERAALLRDFARKRNFDLVHLPGLDRTEANRFNVFDAPFHFDALREFLDAARAGRIDAFFREHPLDLAPRRDTRPFPDRFLKWSRLPALYRTTGERFYTLMMSGEMVVLAVFAQSLLVSLALLLPPLIRLRGRRGRGATPRTVYFLSVGAGFMLAEIFFIKTLTSLFADPVVSFAVVLASIMVASGAGGFLSRRWTPERLGPVLALLIGGLLLLSAGSAPLLRQALFLPPFPRWLLGVLLPVPAGILMGVPFAGGMRWFSTGPGDRAAAWAANGCASVLGAAGAMGIALSAGIPAIGFAAAGAYALAWLCGRIARVPASERDRNAGYQPGDGRGATRREDGASSANTGTPMVSRDSTPMIF